MHQSVLLIIGSLVAIAFSKPVLPPPPAIDIGVTGIWPPLDPVNNETLKRSPQGTPTGQRAGTHNQIAECDFEFPSNNGYAYIQLKLGNGHKACIGWATMAQKCGAGGWPDPDNTEIQRAVQQQTTKDGIFKTTTVGNWWAYWGPGTTTSAVANRDLYNLHFQWAFAMVNGDRKTEKFTTYYFSFDGDYMRIDRKIRGLIGSCY